MDSVYKFVVHHGFVGLIRVWVIRVIFECSEQTVTFDSMLYGVQTILRHCCHHIVFV